MGEATIRDRLADLRAYHLTLKNRRDQTAIDLPSALFLLEVCWTERAERVLELGSGFSSWVLREWQRREGPSSEVWTVDDEEPWLLKTVGELKSLKFRTDHCMTYANLQNMPLVEYFDVIFLDMDSTATRVENARKVVEWLKHGGILLMDDWHMEHYRVPMTSALEEMGMGVVAKPGTADQWGRHLAWSRKP